MTVLPVVAPVVTTFMEGKLTFLPILRNYLPWLAVFFVSGFVAYLSLIQPVVKLEPIAIQFLDILGRKIMDFGKRLKIQPRLNILLVGRRLRWLGLRRYLYSAWGLRMENQPDVGACFAASKGVAGEVFRTGRPRVVNIEEASHEDWGFSKREARKFEGLTAIYCWPIYQVDHRGYQTGKIIGTVNFDSRQPGACNIMVQEKERIGKLLEEFSEFASKIFS